MYKKLFLIAGIFLLAACSPAVSPEVSSSADSSDAVQVTVSVLPQQYFVERIGGEHVEVNVMVLPGESPVTYEPKPAQMADLSGSAMYFSIGVPFESVWLDRMVEANPDMQVVDTAQGIDRMPIADHHHEGEEEDEDHDEEGENLDPHIWTSPELVKIQAQNIYAALVNLDPANGADYKANLDAFVSDIEVLQSELQITLSGLEGNKFMVFHPSWGYFAEDFGLIQIPVEVGGQEPSAQELAALIEEAEHEDIRIIFAQPEFSTSAAETIAQEIDGEVLLISPLALDWLDNLQKVADTFAEVLRN